jgi:cytolysin (calcineurin-like family phosphatase)
VYEVHGNHDSPHGTGHAIDKIIERNQNRPGLVNLSANGLHYSWDWNQTHFINLGLIVGTDHSISRRRRYAALDSLDFLVSDLREKVGNSGRPIIITHHVDIARYTTACDPEGPATSKEWDPCDVRAFHQALADFNIAAIFYGHTHARNIFRWDGASAKATEGIHVFNTDNASHFGGDAQAFFYVEMYENQLKVREYQTKDRWQSGFFTPQIWKAPLAN